MTTYKINGKEINGTRINELVYGNDPLENTVNNCVVKNVLVQLLEALSDKEEEPKPNKWCKMFNCDGSCKTKEPKQEECLHLKQKILHKLDGSTEETCRDCGKDIGGSKQEIYSKQSTSLKENAAGIIYEYLRASGIIFNTIDSKEMASKILKLIQSHLLKDCCEKCNKIIKSI